MFLDPHSPKSGVATFELNLDDGSTEGNPGFLYSDLPNYVTLLGTPETTRNDGIETHSVQIGFLQVEHGDEEDTIVPLSYVEFPVPDGVGPDAFRGASIVIDRLLLEEEDESITLIERDEDDGLVVYRASGGAPGELLDPDGFSVDDLTVTDGDGELLGGDPDDASFNDPFKFDDLKLVSAASLFVRNDGTLQINPPSAGA